MIHSFSKRYIFENEWIIYSNPVLSFVPYITFAFPTIVRTTILCYVFAEPKLKCASVSRKYTIFTASF
jgi:hypothetical protein